MKRTKILTAVACALLSFSLLGCGTNNKLQSIQLNAALINGVAPSSQSGFTTLQGNGGTIQLQAIGSYSDDTTKDITNAVTYTVIVDPTYNADVFGNTLVPPCQAPKCPNPSSPPYSQGTVEYSQTGLLTAVEPATCTWVDVAPVTTPGTAPTPAWYYVGDYIVTATYRGVTSQPFYVPIASSAGSASNPSLGAAGNDNNPDELCGSGT